MEKQLELLKRISEVNGVSGHEKQVAKLVINELKDHVSKIEGDNLGSVIAIKDGEKDQPVVMLSAHMDEVGFLVHRIEESGFIRLHPVGGWWGHVLLAQVMTVTTREGKEFIGVIGAQPPHGMSPEDRRKVLEIKDMYLDLGVGSKKEVEALGIQVGNMITPKTDFRVLNDGKTLLGKAWDDRICVAVGIETMKALKNIKTPSTIALAATVQEEVGLRGARTASYHIKPDIAIALDVTMSYDLPGSPSNPTKLGTSFALSLMDGSVIAHKGLFDFVESVAKETNFPYTYDLLTAGGTDSGEIHKQYDGVVTMTISLPCRYFHSHVSLVNYDDYQNLVRFLAVLLTKFDKNVLADLKASKFR